MSMFKRNKKIKILGQELKRVRLNSSEELPFEEKEVEKKYYKIIFDGSHYVATKIKRSSNIFKRNKAKTNEYDDLFDSLYFLAVKSNLQPKQYFNFIKDEFVNTYEIEASEKIDEYIKEKIKQKLHNLHKRKELFRRKANLNRWNYFVTITYDDKKHSATSFRQKLRKCLCNLHTRRKWRYMGVFELAPETNRLHFHALIYIPDGQMIETIEELQDYSTSQHKMQTSHSNTFFASKFGRNDFTPIKQTEMTVNYILKYLSKTNERIVYSRGIADHIVKELKDYDIACEFLDYVYKYVLFDDVIDWEKDIMHYKYKQASFFDCA